MRTWKMKMLGDKWNDEPDKKQLFGHLEEYMKIFYVWRLLQFFERANPLTISLTNVIVIDE